MDLGRDVDTFSAVRRRHVIHIWSPTAHSKAAHESKSLEDSDEAQDMADGADEDVDHRPTRLGYRTELGK